MAAYRGLRYPRVNRTVDTTLIVSDCGGVFSNTGATGTVNFTMPSTLEDGAVFTFRVTAAQTINIIANVGQTIRMGTGTPGTLSSNVVGTSVIVTGYGNEWSGDAASGTWNTASWLPIGTVAETVCAGNDARLENSFKMTSDVTSSSAAFVNIDALSFAALANTDYIFECFLIFQSASTGKGISVSATGPAAPTAFVMQTFIPEDVNLVRFDSIRAYDTGGFSTQVDTANANCMVTVHGLFRNGVNAGTLQMRFHVETAGTAATIKAGSTIRWRVV